MITRGLHEIMNVTLGLRELHKIHAFPSIPCSTDDNQYHVQSGIEQMVLTNARMHVF